MRYKVRLKVWRPDQRSIEVTRKVTAPSVAVACKKVLAREVRLRGKETELEVDVLMVFRDLSLDGFIWAKQLGETTSWTPGDRLTF